MDLKKIIGSVAPFLGTMIGGPFGAAAGAVVSRVLLNKDDADDAELEAAMSQATPEQLVKLKAADAEYKIKMAKLGISEQKIAALDRDSARNREILTGDRVPAVLAVCLTAGFFSVLSIIMFYPIQPAAKEVINIMLGSLGTAWISCITYYFGSSHGSRVKTDLMKKP